MGIYRKSYKWGKSNRRVVECPQSIDRYPDGDTHRSISGLSSKSRSEERKHVVYAGLEGQLEKAIEFRHDENRTGRVGLVNYSVQDTVLIDNFEVIPDSIIVAVEKRGKLTTVWGKIKGDKLSLVDND